MIEGIDAMSRNAKAAADLAPRQERFVEEYLLDLNAKQAAIRAGYSPKTAEAQGSRLLSHVKVQRALTARMAARSQRTEIGADRALLEIARLGFSDLRRIFDEHGHLKRPEEWDADTAAAVASVKVRTLKDGNETVEVTEIRLWDKNAALDKLGKHLGLFKAMGDAMAQGRSERLTDLTEGELIERLLDRRARRAKWVEAKSERETTRSPRLQ